MEEEVKESKFVVSCQLGAVVVNGSTCNLQLLRWPLRL